MNPVNMDITESLTFPKVTDRAIFETEGGGTLSFPYGQLCHDAKREIIRLRLEVEELKQMLKETKGKE